MLSNIHLIEFNLNTIPTGFPSCQTCCSIYRACVTSSAVAGLKYVTRVSLTFHHSRNSIPPRIFLSRVASSPPSPPWAFPTADSLRIGVPLGMNLWRNSVCVYCHELVTSPSCILGSSMVTTRKCPSTPNHLTPFWNKKDKPWFISLSEQSGACHCVNR